MALPVKELLFFLKMLENNKITELESTALSIIRVFAMVLIVLCHIAQCYDLQAAWLLNVGVQIFFFMSGFLYGKLNLPSSPFAFYKKRLVKLYFPYIIWVTLIVCVYAVFNLYKPNKWQLVLYFFNLQWFSTPIDGLNHLWFLTVLMVGYLMTPWVKRIHERYPLFCILAFVICCVIEFVIIKKFYSFFAWVALYFAGMLYGAYNSKKLSNVVLLVTGVFLIVMGMLFKMDWLNRIEYRYHNIWLHWALGLFLFALFYRIIPLIIKSDKENVALKHLDQISYEVYLTHHPLILGPLSMMFITRYVLLNVLLMLMAVYALSRALHYVSSFTNKLL